MKLEEVELEVLKLAIQKLEQLELERQEQPPPKPQFIVNTTTSTHPSCSLISQADSPSP